MLHYRSLSEVAESLAKGDVGAVELLDAMLERIAHVDPRLRAFVTVTADRARAAAHRADAARAIGMRLGPLHGVPIAIKDIFEVAGVPMTAGMPMRADTIAARTATVVRRLEAAGAVLLGTLKLSEGAFGDYRPADSTPVNPWSEQLWPGASSGGSGVAVAGGLCFGSIATDTGGSIRMPSAACGTTGLKPGWGRVSRHGVFELAATLDHVGPIARSAADAAILFDVIAGDDPDDPTSLTGAPPACAASLDEPVAGLVVAHDPLWLKDIGADAAAALDGLFGVLKAHGVLLREVRLPDGADVAADWYTICAAQTALVHGGDFAARPNLYGPSLATVIRYGLKLDAASLQRALHRRMIFASRLERALAGVDALALPVFPFATPTLAEVAAMDEATIFALHRFTCPFSLAGAPVVTFPAGRGPGGEPVGLQLAGRKESEHRLLRLCNAFQQQTDHHARRPTAFP